MRSAALICIGLASITVSACGQANAEALDGKNPLACVVAFEEYADLAAKSGRDNESRGYLGRSQWYISQVRAMPEQDRTEEAINKLLVKLRASSDGGLSVATDCVTREDADPSFQALVKAHGG